MRTEQCTGTDYMRIVTTRETAAQSIYQTRHNHWYSPLSSPPQPLEPEGAKLI